MKKYITLKYNIQNIPQKYPTKNYTKRLSIISDHLYAVNDSAPSR